MHAIVSQFTVLDVRRNGMSAYEPIFINTLLKDLI